MKPSSRSLTVQLTKNTPALTHKHTHSTTYSDTRGPCDVSKGDFPCHTRVSDRLYKCCVTVWLPLSFRFSLCFCVSGCLSLSVHVASIHRVFASPPEPSLTLSRLPAIPNSAVLFTLALLFFISEHLSLHYLCLLNFPFHKSRSEFFFFFLFFFFRGLRYEKKYNRQTVVPRRWFGYFPLAFVVQLSTKARMCTHVWCSTGDDLSHSECKHHEHGLPKYARYVISHKLCVKELHFTCSLGGVCTCTLCRSLICICEHDQGWWFVILWQHDNFTCSFNVHSVSGAVPSLALSQHVGVCCVIVHFACWGARRGCVAAWEGLCVTLCVRVCVC